MVPAQASNPKRGTNDNSTVFTSTRTCSIDSDGQVYVSRALMSGRVQWSSTRCRVKLSIQPAVPRSNMLNHISIKNTISSPATGSSFLVQQNQPQDQTSGLPPRKCPAGAISAVKQLAKSTHVQLLLSIMREKASEYDTTAMELAVVVEVESLSVVPSTQVENIRA